MLSILRDSARSRMHNALHRWSHYRPRFLAELGDGAEVFDIGCGNDSPYVFKSARPDIRYVGLDVGDYQQAHDPEQYADEYLLVPPEGFLAEIRDRAGQFDAVTSNHNLEHCADPDAVVVAMARALRPGGRLLLVFPAAATEKLPSRGGTLNFYDDPTHVQPPDYQRVLELLTSEGVKIEFTSERYRPPVWVALGFLNEYRSRSRDKIMTGTWALYGFETVIWGTKS